MQTKLIVNTPQVDIYTFKTPDLVSFSIRYTQKQDQNQSGLKNFIQKENQSKKGITTSKQKLNQNENGQFVKSRNGNKNRKGKNIGSKPLNKIGKKLNQKLQTKIDQMSLNKTKTKTRIWTYPIQ